MSGPLLQKNGTWLLETDTTFPLTVTGLNENQVRKLRQALSKSLTREFLDEAGSILEAPGFRWLELENYVDEWKPVYEKGLGGRNPDNLEDEDGEDPAERLRIEATRGIQVRLDIGDLGLALLMEGDRNKWMVGDMLFRTYFHGNNEFDRGSERYLSERLFKGWEFSSVSDDRRCPTCAAMEGKRFPVSAPPKLPLHIGCRCMMIGL